MNPPSSNEFAPTIERFTGWADLYDRHRPEPPAMLAEIVARLSGEPSPGLVVDLGSGTGLSARYWATHAREVIGIEPSADMRRVAVARTAEPNVSYREGFSHQTGLPDACAAVVSCAQALHWMEPRSTFREVARILRPGGAFAACDYDWPPTTGRWEVEVGYNECVQQAERLERERQISAGLQSWRDKENHLGRMRDSGCFRFVKEVVVHHIDDGNAERLVGILLGQGPVAGLMKRGATEAELGINRFRETAQRVLGSEPRPWIWSSRVRLGVA